MMAVSRLALSLLHLWANTTLLTKVALAKKNTMTLSCISVPADAKIEFLFQQ